MNNENKGIKILSIEMGSYYDYVEGNRKSLDLGKAVLDYSLFSEFMIEKGMKVNKRGKTYDFIMCKFSYGSGGCTRSESRVQSYEDAFSLDWDKYYEQHGKNELKSSDKKIGVINYKRLCRSTGKAKEGDCIFVNENLFNAAYKYLYMGIKPSEDNPKIVELNAYATLTMANMIDSITIPLKNILILEDQPVYTKKKAVIVKTRKEILEVEAPNYKQSESAANKAGYTFYKNNEKVEGKFEYIKDQSKKGIENTGIELITKKRSASKITRDYDAMEQQANQLGYTLVEGKTNYSYIKSRSSSILSEHEISIISKQIIAENDVMDYHAMEPQANKLGKTFFKKDANKDGFELIDRDILEAESHDIELTYNVDKKKIDVCYVERPEEEVEIKNIMWDGMGLIDSSLMPEGCSGFVYLRNHFTKMCLFEGEVIQFLKEIYGDRYETATRKDCLGNDINVRDIRVITTNNSIKWIGKFENQMGNNPYEYFKNIIEEHGNKFSVVKTAHPSKYGKLQRSSYQGNNSLPCVDREILTKIAQTSIDYANDLKNDDDKFLQYLEATKTNYNINGFLIDLAKHNRNILRSDFYGRQRSQIISMFKREKLEKGKLLQVGDNLTIAGNVYSLLLYAAELNWKDDPTLKAIPEGVQCYTTRFKDGENLAGYRNPHNAPNNFGYYVNHYSNEMQKYFPNLGDNVICINMINTDNQARLSGHDMDTDGIYCTNQPEMVKLSMKCCADYPTMINEIPLVSKLTEEEQREYIDQSGWKPYGYTMDEVARMDSDIAKYQCGIGWSSNVAQLALSYYWDELANTNEKNKELEDVYIICSALAQCFIDSSKRLFALDLNKELLRLSRLDCMKRDKKYPRFYAELQLDKQKPNKNDSHNKRTQKKEAIEKINNNIMEKCLCPMEILADIIDKGIINKTGTNKGNSLDIEGFLLKKKEVGSAKKQSRKKAVEQMIIDYDVEMKKLDSGAEDYTELSLDLLDKLIDDMSRIEIHKTEYYELVRRAFGLDGKKYDNNLCKRILIVLYQYDKRKNRNTLLNLFNGIKIKRCA